MKKNIAIIMGGYSSEYEISIESGKAVFDVLDKNKFNCFRVVPDIPFRSNWIINWGPYFDLFIEERKETTIQFIWNIAKMEFNNVNYSCCSSCHTWS